MLKRITMAAMMMVLLGAFTQPVRSAPPGGRPCAYFRVPEINDWVWLGYLGSGEQACIDLSGDIYNAFPSWGESYDWDYYTFELIGTTQFVVEVYNEARPLLYTYNVQTQQWQLMSCQARLCRGQAPTGRVYLAVGGQRIFLYSMFIY